MTRAKRTKKVLRFVESVRKHLEGGRRLNSRQEKRLTRLMQHYGLLADEETARTATRVAGRYLNPGS